MFRAATAVFLAASMLFLPGCLWNQYKAKTTITQSVPHQVGTGIEVKTLNGSVRVVGDSSASQVEITAKVTCGGVTQEDADSRITQAKLNVTRQAYNTLLIEPVFPGPTKVNGDGASFEIRIPDATGVTIDTSNGSINVQNLSGQLLVDTSNGSVNVKSHDGPITIDTSNGKITAVDIAGSATIDTSNGSIKLVLASGQTGPINADTSNGSINITVGQAFAGSVRFDTSNGRLIITDSGNVLKSKSLGKNDGTIKFKNDGGTSVVDTSNGGITFTIDNTL